MDIFTQNKFFPSLAVFVSMRFTLIEIKTLVKHLTGSWNIYCSRVALPTNKILSRMRVCQIRSLKIIAPGPGASADVLQNLVCLEFAVADSFALELWLLGVGTIIQ